jgi:hypothetical protein
VSQGTKSLRPGRPPEPEDDQLLREAQLKMAQALQAMEALRPAPKEFKQTQEGDLFPQLAEILRKAPAPSQDVKQEFVQDSEEAPPYQVGRDERLSPTVDAERRRLTAGQSERLAVGTPRSQDQIDSTLKELEGLTSENIRTIREREERVNFTKRYGQEPDGIRWTPDGEPVATMSGANFDSLMNRLKMRRAVEDVESSRAQREGTDPESIARNRAREQQDEALSLRQRELEASEQKAAAKEQAAKEKEEQAFRLDAASVLPRAKSGSPATKAFARYIEAVNRGDVETAGFEPSMLEAAELGANELINIHGGVGQGGLNAAGDSTLPERRNIKQYIAPYLERLLADRKAAADRRQRAEVNSVDRASIPGGMPELPESPANTRATLQNVLQAPEGANTNPAGPGFMNQVATMLGGGYPSPGMTTSQMSAMPTSTQAVQRLRDLLASNTPVARLVTSLMTGRGSEAQRNAAMQWITSNYGIDPNQLILRTSIHSDPVWMDQTRKALQSIKATETSLK